MVRSVLVSHLGVLIWLNYTGLNRQFIGARRGGRWYDGGDEVLLSPPQAEACHEVMAIGCKRGAQREQAPQAPGP